MKYGAESLFGGKKKSKESSDDDEGGEYSAAAKRRAKLLAVSLGLDPADVDMDGVCEAMGMGADDE